MMLWQVGCCVACEGQQTRSMYALQQEVSMAAKIVLHVAWQQAAFLMWGTVCSGCEVALHADPKLRCTPSCQLVSISRAEATACLLERQQLEMQVPVLLRSFRPLVNVSEDCRNSGPPTESCMPACRCIRAALLPTCRYVQQSRCEGVVGLYGICAFHLFAGALQANHR